MMQVTTGIVAHLNEPEPTLQYEPGVVDPQLVRNELQRVQLREGFGAGKVVPVWSVLIAAARYAIEDLLREVARQTWIPIGVRSPEQGQAVLVVCSPAKGAAIRLAHFIDGQYGVPRGYISVTHWMPLPSSPSTNEVPK